MLRPLSLPMITIVNIVTITQGLRLIRPLAGANSHFSPVDTITDKLK
jgi:hypothetical protein